jgi:serine/threonine protein kinase
VAHGGFADIFGVQDADKARCALKLIADPDERAQLHNEYIVLQTWSKGPRCDYIVTCRRPLRDDAGTIQGLLLHPLGTCIMEQGGTTMHGFHLLTFAAHLITALSFAHARGICHCDVRPRNMIFHDGRYLLIDWGLSIGYGTSREGEVGHAAYLHDELLDKAASRPIRTYAVAPHHDWAGLAYSLFTMQNGGHCPWAYLRNRPAALREARQAAMLAWLAGTDPEKSIERDTIQTLLSCDGTSDSTDADRICNLLTRLQAETSLVDQLASARIAEA